MTNDHKEKSMTRETKVGLFVAASFLCLVGVVIAAKLRQVEDPADADTVARLKNVAPTPAPANGTTPLTTIAPGTPAKLAPWLVSATYNQEPPGDPIIPVPSAPSSGNSGTASPPPVPDLNSAPGSNVPPPPVPVPSGSEFVPPPPVPQIAESDQ